MLHRVVNDLRTKITPEFAVIAGITGAKASLILQTKRKLSGGEDPAPMIRPVFIATSC